MTTQDVRRFVVKASTAAILAGAIFAAAPAKAQGQQFGFAAQFGTPAYGYDDDRRAAWEHEHYEHERAEQIARHEAWERQQDYLRQQAWARQQDYLRHEAWEHGETWGHGYDRRGGDWDRDRERDHDGDRWR